MAGTKFLLTLKLTKQGVITGSNAGAHRAGGSAQGLECHGFDYEPLSPRDSATGLPTGKRMHNPISIIREVDAASPKLLQALTSNEAIQTATLSFARPDAGGRPSPVETIVLTNAAISKINIYHPEVGTGKSRQKITLTYESIKVNGVPDGIIPRSMMG